LQRRYTLMMSEWEYCDEANYVRNLAIQQVPSRLDHGFGLSRAWKSTA
jgi:hypothetical protein